MKKAGIVLLVAGTAAILLLLKNEKRTAHKGGLIWGFIRSKSDLFPQFCVKNPRQVSALPWILSCLAEKSLVLECFAVLNRRFFSHGCIQRTKEYWMYFKDDGSPVGKKMHSKPCKSLCESAPKRFFLYLCKFVILKLEAVTHIHPKGQQGDGDLADHTGVVVFDIGIVATDIDDGTEHGVLLLENRPRVTGGGVFREMIGN